VNDSTGGDFLDQTILGARMNKALLLAAVVWLGLTTPGIHRADAARACSQVSAPVCALKKDGSKQTFTNASCAAAEGARVLHKDSCRWVTCVPWKKVCALDPTTRKPTTYSSVCSAEYYHATVLSDGACKKG
jgi:hypothetical protein